MRSIKGIMGAAFCAGSLLLGPAWADEAPPKPSDTRPTMDFGLARGGARIASKTFYIGGTSDIHAGDAYYGDIGVLHDFEGGDWSFKGTIGYSFALITAFNSSITFKRFPLDMLIIYNDGRQHLGMGVTWHFNPRIDTGDSGHDVRYDDAGGLLLQYQYSHFGVRYTYIRYRAHDLATHPSFDGSSLGLFINLTFGR
jgi:hypothetical protein